MLHGTSVTVVNTLSLPQPVDVERWPNSLPDRSVAHVWLSAPSLFEDEAMLAASIHQRSTTACVRGAKVQTETECYSHTYGLVIQPEPT